MNLQSLLFIFVVVGEWSIEWSVLLTISHAVRIVRHALRVGLGRQAGQVRLQARLLLAPAKPETDF